MNLIWLALALGIATMLMGYFSSAQGYESFIGSLCSTGVRGGPSR
jgi:hypothetical protein